MAAATARPRLHLRYDDLFFSGMAAVALIAVLVGFARTYFLAGLFRSSTPEPARAHPWRCIYQKSD
jgi:hypothetical protein